MTTGESVAGGFAGAILDVDGVLVDSPHERAWREALRELMEGPWRDIRDHTSWRPSASRRRSTGSSCRAGRASGARGPRSTTSGSPPPPLGPRCTPLASRRWSSSSSMRGGSRPIRTLCGSRSPCGRRGSAWPRPRHRRTPRCSWAESESTHSRKEHGLAYGFVTPGLSLYGLVDVDASGRDLDRGKPHPEIFLAAAAELGVPPDRCVVVEDAVSGIQAARAGGLAALAMARAGDARMLAEAGADLVVTSLDDVDVEGLRRLMVARGR